MADALVAKHPDCCPAPDFPLPDELAAVNLETERLLQHKQSPEKKGFGYFAREKIPQGAVLMVAKPLAMAMDWEEEEEDDGQKLCVDDVRGDEEQREDDENSSEPILNSKIVLRLQQKMQKNPALWTAALSEMFPRTKKDLAELSETSRTCGNKRLQAEIEANLETLKNHPQLKGDVDDIAVRLPLIVRYNALSVETMPELLSHPGPCGHAVLGGVGLYHKPSYFNHSALPNVARYAVGDVMWFVANQDIAPDTEACISYIEHDILCENAQRRNHMLHMDFRCSIGEDGNLDSQDADCEDDDQGPSMPVVDSEVQNELMQMDAFERLDSIQELLMQAQGQAPLSEGKDNSSNSAGDDDDDDGVDDEMEIEGAGWFLCDIQNLLVLQAITLEGLDQAEEASKIWDECVDFAETQLPPLDESSIVMRTQAALCSLHLGGDDFNKTDTASPQVQQAIHHAKKALTLHDKLFGGGVMRFRRRYRQDFALSLREGGAKGTDAAVDFLWPLPPKKAPKRAKATKLSAATLCLLAGMMNLCSFAAAFVPPKTFSDAVVKRDKSFVRASLADSFEECSHQFDGCSVLEVQKLLVEKGNTFERQQEVASELNPPTLQSDFEKVPGCVATVRVKTSLRKKSAENWEVCIEGTADALLSRGLLAVLISAMSSVSKPQDILTVDPYRVADQIGVRSALSPGRNDGVASITQVIQQQIESLLIKAESLGAISSAHVPLFADETTKSGSSAGAESQAVVSPLELSHDHRPSKKGKVALLLSGGVDSSVSLRLLLLEGYDVTAFYLKIWLEDELAHLGQCPWEDDYNICRQVCEQAGVPLETLSLQQEYRDRVISYTIHEAQRGRTPNPDILCNSRIKFGCFYDAIEEREFDFVASGHYARLQRGGTESQSSINEKHVRLLRGPDKVKDQSYFLCALSQSQLQRVLFPIGHLEKCEVRELAESFQLPNRHRADSQGLCFLGKVKFDEFLGAYLGERPGDIIDAANGDLLGRHRGVWFHTVGQRKGIGKVLNPLATSRGPWYVVAKDPENDVVFCSNEYDEEIFASARSQFHVEDIKWISGGATEPLIENRAQRFEMKIRHGPRLVSGELALADATDEEGIVKLDQKDGGLAPGQYVAFYEGEECLGGGVISERHWAAFLLDKKELSARFQRQKTC